MVAYSVRINYTTPSYPGWKSETRYQVEARSWQQAESKARALFARDCIPGSAVRGVTSARTVA
jgi:hypothetical protein